MSLNLSNQPFVNSRPVRRLVFVLWCLGVVLVGANLFFYFRHLTGQQQRLDRLDELTTDEARESQRLAELETELAGFDLEWQNRQIEFLNLRIAERVFPWSRLFDRLTEVLPREVRLTRLKPRIESLSGGGAEERVGLEIRGEARNEEAILEFVNELFEHHAFSSPNLSSEDRRPRDNVTEFSLSVSYLPRRAAESAPAGAESAADEGETGADGEETASGEEAEAGEEGETDDQGEAAASAAAEEDEEAEE